MIVTGLLPLDSPHSFNSCDGSRVAVTDVTTLSAGVFFCARVETLSGCFENALPALA